MPISTTVTVTTAAPTLGRINAAPLWEAFAIGMPLMFLFPASVFQNRRKKGIALLFVLAIAFSLISCGGGGSKAAQTTTPPPPTLRGGTPAGTYSLTISATSGTLQSSAVGTLTVSP